MKFKLAAIIDSFKERTVLWVVFLVVLSIVRGPCNMAMKVLHEEWPIYSIFIVRWAVAACCFLLLYCYWIVTKQAPNILAKREDAIRSYWVGFFFLAPAYGLLYGALHYTSTIEVVIIGTSSVAWMALINRVFYHEKLKPFQMVAVTLGVVGSYFALAGFSRPDFHEANMFGNMMAFTGFILEMLGVSQLAHLVKRSSGVGVAGFVSFGVASSGLLYGVLGQIFGFVELSSLFPPLSWESGIALIYTVCIVGFPLYIAWYAIMKHLSTTYVMLGTGIEGVTAILMGGMFLQEPISDGFILGAACIFFSLYLFSLKGGWKTPPPIQT